MELTTRDLMNMFNVSRVTVYTWRRYKNLPYTRLSGNKCDGLNRDLSPVRFEIDKVLAWAVAEDKATPDWCRSFREASRARA